MSWSALLCTTIVPPGTGSFSFVLLRWLVVGEGTIDLNEDLALDRARRGSQEKYQTLMLRHVR